MPTSTAEQMPTLLLRCPVCASDAADTLGVTGTPGGLLNATVVLRCEDCLTVYLSPVADGVVGSPPGLPASVLTKRFVNRWTRSLPSGAMVLCVDHAPEELVSLLSQAGHRDLVISGTEPRYPSSGAGGFDLILLPHSLEAVNDPNALLGQMADLLADGGRIVVIASNAGSSCFGAFGGRHWSGYHLPGTRQYLAPDALRRLGEKAGLSVTQLDTLFVPDAWLKSIANWLRDWGAGKTVTTLCIGNWLLPQAITSILEAVASMRGRGSLLVAQLERQ